MSASCFVERSMPLRHHSHTRFTFVSSLKTTLPLQLQPYERRRPKELPEHQRHVGGEYALACHKIRDTCKRDRAVLGELAGVDAASFEKRFQVPTEVGRPNGLLPDNSPFQKCSSSFRSTTWVSGLGLARQPDSAQSFRASHSAMPAKRTAINTSASRSIRRSPHRARSSCAYLKFLVSAARSRLRCGA